MFFYRKQQQFEQLIFLKRSRWTPRGAVGLLDGSL
jgi:hypothetical protein